MAAHQAPLSLGFSRQEYWNGLPFPSPMHACMLSHFSHAQLCATLWTAAHQAPLSMGFSRQEYQREFLSPPPSGPITSWQIDGETVETVTEFILGGSKITADCDCSHEIKRCLLLGRNAVNNLDSILKGRDITLPTKILPVKVMVFLVVMYGCESWTLKKAEG